MRVTGVDISQVAIETARKRFPEIEFVNDDVKNIRKYSSRDAVLFAEITWYVLDQLPKLFDEILDRFEGKYFLHNLTFYKGGAQRYGREHFTNLEEFVLACPFRLIEWSVATQADEDSTIETSSVFMIKKK